MNTVRERMTYEDAASQKKRNIFFKGSETPARMEALLTNVNWMVGACQVIFVWSGLVRLQLDGQDLSGYKLMARACNVTIGWLGLFR